MRTASACLASWGQIHQKIPTRSRKIIFGASQNCGGRIRPAAAHHPNGPTAMIKTEVVTEILRPAGPDIGQAPARAPPPAPAPASALMSTGLATAALPEVARGRKRLQGPRTAQHATSPLADTAPTRRHDDAPRPRPAVLPPRCGRPDRQLPQSLALHAQASSQRVAPQPHEKDELTGLYRCRYDVHQPGASYRLSD